ncbi:hypothetical protein AX15_004004 [Amanita polypyramis BW_CC]|nr:hypothetical protein AX15_004004 [Amanita polypyramis BW_CC]
MARARWPFGSPQHQQPQGPTKPDSPLVYSADAKKFGLENFGNTCYANSVVQALYFCSPFRDLVLQETDLSNPQQYAGRASLTVTKSSSPYAPSPSRRRPDQKPSISGTPADNVESTTSLTTYIIPSAPPTLFSALRSIFAYVHSHPLEKGKLAPRAFIDKLKETNELFRSSMHQDAHEFLMHLLNRIIEEIEQGKKRTLQSADGPSSDPGKLPQEATIVHKLFEGVLTSETRCLTCETASSRDESFLDLSIDIEKNSSVTACLRQFSASEMLSQRNKFFCDSCCGLQEAERRMKIKKLPNVLALHLKRFKYQEDVQKYIKLTYRVAFPFELRLFNTVDDVEDADRLYNLYAVVVHIGNGPYHGHYISIVKTLGQWSVFDDDNVYPIPEQEISKYFGDSNAGAAYLLYYQAADIDLPALGLQMGSLPHLAIEPTDSSPISNNTLLRPASPVQDILLIPPGLSTDASDNFANGVIANGAPHTDQLESAEKKLVDDNNTNTAVTQLDTNLSPTSHSTQVNHSATRRPSISGIFTGLRRPSSFSRPKTSNLDQKRKSDLPDQPFLNSHQVRLDKSPPSSPKTAKRPATSAGPSFRSDDEKQGEKAESKPGNWFRRRSFKGSDKSRPMSAGTSIIPPLPSFLRPSEQTHPASPFTKARTEVDHQVKQKPSEGSAPDRGRTGASRPHTSAGVLNSEPYARDVQHATGHRWLDRSTNRHESSLPGNSILHGPASLSPPPFPSTSAPTQPSSPIQLDPPSSSPPFPNAHRSSSHTHSHIPNPPSRTLEHRKSMPESNNNRRKYSRPLPPIPPSPVATSQGAVTALHTPAVALTVNGNAHEVAAHHSTLSTASTISSSHTKQSTAHGVHTPGFGVSFLNNEAKGGLMAAANQIKRASRKLSFSAAFGFGRKDKDKHRENEKHR